MTNSEVCNIAQMSSVEGLAPCLCYHWEVMESLISKYDLLT